MLSLAGSLSEMHEEIGRACVCLLSPAQIMKYAEQRVPTLNEYCVVCDEQHVFQNGSMLKVRAPELMFFFMRKKIGPKCVFVCK